MIRRKIEYKIKNWLKNHNDMALMIDGARQVGKTTSIIKVLEDEQCDFVTFNLLKDKNFLELFYSIENISTNAFLQSLTACTTHKLTQGQTIIFIDEVQVCKELVTKVKFLVEEGSYRYIFSGSNLGIELSNIRSFPVGYMATYKMYPLDFEEFANALGVPENTIALLEEHFHNKKSIPPIIHSKMMNIFYQYLIVGGMPLAVQNFIDNQNYNQTMEIHNFIVNLYKEDFAKYQDNDKKLKLKAVYNLIPSELNAQNKRYIFNNLNKEFRFSRYEATFEWLCAAEVAIPIYNVTSPEFPLKHNEKANLFKLFLNDVGLLTSMYGMGTVRKILAHGQDMNYGAIYENFVAQELHAHEYPGFYYSGKKYGELDFLIEEEMKTKIIEVKSGKEYTRHSALDHAMANKTWNIKDAYVLCNSNISYENVAVIEKTSRDYMINDKYKIVYMPIYMTMFIDQNKIVLPKPKMIKW